MRIIGIDPGLDGFISCIDDMVHVGSWPMPTVKVKTKSNRRLYNPQEIREILKEFKPDYVVIEIQQKRRGEGQAATFTTGRGYSLCEGIVVGMNLRYLMVAARTWTKQMHKDITGTDTKAKSILAAQRLFPDVDLRKSDRCRVINNGKADSLLLALYGHKNFPIEANAGD